MARFCPVAPPRILREMSHAGPSHLILAHDIVRTPEEYDEYFGRPIFNTIILDNSVAELGASVDVKVIHEAAKVSHANVVVLPDVYYEGKATVDACREALDAWPSPLFNNREVMYVPQGHNFEEWARSAQELADDDRVHWWGIPRNMVTYHGTRRLGIDIAHMLNPKRKIHLLGFSDSIIDDLWCARQPQVTSIDSAVPLRIASINIPLVLDLGELPKRGKWFEEATYLPSMDYNVEKVRQWIR